MNKDSLQRRRKLLALCAFTVPIGAASFLIARILVKTISLFTNIFYSGSLSWKDIPPNAARWGYAAALVPAAGGLIVGLMARYGSAAIRGHGIPEAMEKILEDEARIPPRMTILKPLSSAIAIGSGGPFGAEGPIIATGGAFGSWLGQILPVSPVIRKVMLASGAAAGMTSIFGAPFSSVLLAIELLLFEFRAKSFIPVAVAAATAESLRLVFLGSAPVFPMGDFAPPGLAAMFTYAGIGLFSGVLAVIFTKIVYWIEDAFEHSMPLHWMWWPAIGGIAVGLIGLLEPKTLGVGYQNIVDCLNDSLTMQAAALLLVCKLLSWSLALGSGTSGGTLAPLFTLGGSSGLLLGHALQRYFPQLGLDPKLAALVGMTAVFSGASRAVLASVIFAFETTGRPLALLPLLAGCSASYLSSILLMENSIMTEKIARRGVKVPHEYYPR